MKKIAVCGLMIALAMAFSYIESLIPVPFAVPGIKLGLANIVVVFSLYKLGIKEAISVSIIRVILVAFLFGSLSSMIYALSGAFFSIILMILLKKYSGLHIISVSVAGAIGHIGGQLLVAGMVVGYEPLLFYMAPLLVAAFITGVLVGALANLLVKRIPIDM